MMRALGAFFGFVLLAVGLVVTFVTWTVDGWTMLALLGFALIVNDLRIEDREQGR